MKSMKNIKLVQTTYSKSNLRVFLEEGWCMHGNLTIELDLSRGAGHWAMANLSPERCGKEKGFGDNHEIMIISSGVAP
jgi:hypothetical protein